MKKMHPRFKLLIRLLILMVVMIPLGIYFSDDGTEKVSAGRDFGEEVVKTADAAGTANAGADVFGADAVGTAAEGADALGADAAGTEVSDTEDQGMSPEVTESLMAETDGCEANGKTEEVGGEESAGTEEILPEDYERQADALAAEEAEEAAEEAEEAAEASEIPEYGTEEWEAYRHTQTYINTLLVTSEEFYNADVVLGAILPTDSNDDRYEFLTGSGYKAYTVNNMPKGYRSDAQASANMTTFDVPVWKMDSAGNKYSDVWEITVNAKLADSVRCIFSDIYLLDIKFPFNYLKGYMYRKVGGSGLVNSKLMSIHAFGAAIDINYWDADNDYYLGKGNDLRDKDNPYCIPDEVIEIFESYGWNWGGNFDICADTMHFQYFGLEFLQYDSDEPFPILYYGEEDMEEKYVTNLQNRLKKLGFLKKVQSSYNEKVDQAVRAFQEAYGLEVNGIVNYVTWVPLINATHDMSYAF